MTPEAVAQYLQEYPEFFELYADVIAEIYIPHPHGGRTISISERQILTLREKSKQLEAKLQELIQFGEENDAIGEKVHRLSLSLLGATSVAAVGAALRDHLMGDFSVPHVALRLWGAGVTPPPAAQPEVSEAARQFAATLAHPYCGAQPVAGVDAWFGDSAPLLRSFACVALNDKEGQAVGLLVLASEDPQRFYPEMGTLHLRHIGELAFAALARAQA